jgi:hypothetical protein
LKTDLGETNNVASKYPEVIVRIETYLKTARTDSTRWPLRLPSDAPEKVTPAEVN